MNDTEFAATQSSTPTVELWVCTYSDTQGRFSTETLADYTKHGPGARNWKVIGTGTKELMARMALRKQTEFSGYIFA
jgi:hypothetical protein